MRILIDLQSTQGMNANRGIGRYSLSLSQELARQAKEHEVYLLLNANHIQEIETVRSAFVNIIPHEQIKIFDVPKKISAQDFQNLWRIKASEKIREYFIETLSPDVVYISSIFEGWTDDSPLSIGEFQKKTLTAATLYDLIPYIYQDKYIQKQAPHYFFQKMQYLKRSELLITLSDSASKEAIEHLAFPSQRIVNCSVGIDKKFKVRNINVEDILKLKETYNINRYFIFYIGGFDFRKNIFGLIEAFFLLPSSLQKKFQLVIILSVNKSQITEFFNLIRTRWSFSDELILIDYVPEEDLITLYNSCSLFVFASLHEGFGLPIIEAMACGAPTICSNISSMPEAIGCQEALFDPKNPQSIANKITKVLDNKDFLNFLKQHGLNQAKKFTWENTAKKALAAFEDLYASKIKSANQTVNILSNKKMAFISPLPPTKTDTADFSARLLPELARFYDIVLITDQSKVDDNWLNANFEIHNTEWFIKHNTSFDIILYQIANSYHHTTMMKLLHSYPGIVILHDFFLSKLLNCMDTIQDKTVIFDHTLYESHGYFALNYDKKNGRDDTIKTYPCSLSLISRALGIIIHSADIINLAEKWYGSNIISKFKNINPNQHLAKLGDEYYRVINNFCFNPYFRERDLIKHIAENDNSSINSEDIIAIATAISANRSPIGYPQLLIDISELINDQAINHKSLSYNVLLDIMNTYLPDYRVEPIYYHKIKNKYLYARKFILNSLGFSENSLQDSAVDIKQDDIYLALSPPKLETTDIKENFTYWKAKGTKFYCLICEPQIIMMNHLFEVVEVCFCLKSEYINKLNIYLNTMGIKRKNPLKIAAVELENFKQIVLRLFDVINKNQWAEEWTKKTSDEITYHNFINRTIYIDKIKYEFKGDKRYLGEQCEDYDPTLISIFKSFCNENSYVLDLGANIGITSIALANICKKGKVAAVEPVPITFQMLKSNVKNANLNNNISLHNFAIGNKKGEISMQLRTDFLAGAFVSDRYQADHQHHTVIVNIECLDDIFDKFGFTRLDFIKMDLEGYELFALEGAKKIIKKFKPIVYLEMNHWCLNVFYRITLPEFKERLQAIFPYIFAIEYPSYLDFTTVDNFYHIAHEHITTTRKYFNLIAGFDKDEIIERFSYSQMISELA